MKDCLIDILMAPGTVYRMIERILALKEKKKRFKVVKNGQLSLGRIKLN